VLGCGRTHDLLSFLPSEGREIMEELSFRERRQEHDTDLPARPGLRECCPNLLECEEEGRRRIGSLRGKAEGD
jgi:hypothetical protein